MNCPNCSTKFSLFGALASRSGRFRCLHCGKGLKLTGYWWLIISPVFLMLIFPFDSINSMALTVVLIFFGIMTISLLALKFGLSVRVDE
jgi:hypothetical protein